MVGLLPVLISNRLAFTGGTGQHLAGSHCTFLLAIFWSMDSPSVRWKAIQSPVGNVNHLIKSTVYPYGILLRDASVSSYSSLSFLGILQAVCTLTVLIKLRLNPDVLVSPCFFPSPAPLRRLFSFMYGVEWPSCARCIPSVALGSNKQLSCQYSSACRNSH